MPESSKIQLPQVGILESLSYNAWPALTTMIYDGWILRFANGYTKRANSINPLYSGNLPLIQKHAYCEQEYHRHNLPVLYKLTSQSPSSEIEAFLKNLNYDLVDLTSVQLKKLSTTPNDPKSQIKFIQVEELSIDNEFTSRWLKQFLNLNQDFKSTKSQRLTMTQILQNIFPQRWFYTWFEKKKVVACGLGVLQDGYYGMFDIIVHPDSRSQGFASKLIYQMLAHAQSQGAHTSYLQLVKTNTIATRLYQRFGFEEKYTYWYRKEPKSSPKI